MRRRLILASVAALAAGAGLVVLIVSVQTGERSGDPAPGRATASGLVARTLQAGDVEVRIEPLRIDDEGARFLVGFDTHSVELSLDVAGSAALEIDGLPWTRPAWEGGPPSGHHRSGELRFAAAGPARGVVRLSIDGLAEPVEASWDLAGRAP